LSVAIDHCVRVRVQNNAANRFTRVSPGNRITAGTALRDVTAASSIPCRPANRIASIYMRDAFVSFRVSEHRSFRKKKSFEKNQYAEGDGLNPC